MNGWTVTLDVETSRPRVEAELEELVDALASYGAAVAGAGRRLTVTLSARAESVERALEFGRAALAQSVGVFVVVGAHVRTFEEHDRELELEAAKHSVA